MARRILFRPISGAIFFLLLLYEREREKEEITRIQRVENSITIQHPSSSGISTETEWKRADENQMASNRNGIRVTGACPAFITTK